MTRTRSSSSSQNETTTASSNRILSPENRQSRPDLLPNCIVKGFLEAVNREGGFFKQGFSLQRLLHNNKDLRPYKSQLRNKTDYLRYRIKVDGFKQAFKDYSLQPLASDIEHLVSGSITEKDNIYSITASDNEDAQEYVTPRSPDDRKLSATKRQIPKTPTSCSSSVPRKLDYRSPSSAVAMAPTTIIPSYKTVRRVCCGSYSHCNSVKPLTSFLSHIVP